jgi:peptidoglycan/xylan/chitin deacetylase (PgdA/CDA1 family)
MKAYLSTRQIFDSIVAYESKDPAGLNGFILLLHAGTDPARTDKFSDRLGDLLKFLHEKGYLLIRVDDLLKGKK